MKVYRRAAALLDCRPVMWWPVFVLIIHTVVSSKNPGNISLQVRLVWCFV